MCWNIILHPEGGLFGTYIFTVCAFSCVQFWSSSLPLSKILLRFNFLLISKINFSLAVCTGHDSSFVENWQISPRVSYMRLKRQFGRRNCTHISGNLVLSHLDVFDGKFCSSAYKNNFVRKLASSTRFLSTIRLWETENIDCENSGFNAFNCQEDSKNSFNLKHTTDRDWIWKNVRHGLPVEKTYDFRRRYNSS